LSKNTPICRARRYKKPPTSYLFLEIFYGFSWTRIKEERDSKCQRVFFPPPIFH
jgi:hypothetical protein